MRSKITKKYSKFRQIVKIFQFFIRKLAFGARDRHANRKYVKNVR